MNFANKGSIVGRWVVLNTAALLVGYVLYTPIAHGIPNPERNVEPNYKAVGDIASPHG
jgi:hypothetical protein